jgi:hypothetical protein
MPLGRTGERLVTDLMTAILAVNRWTPERAFTVTQQFNAVGLVDPADVSRMEVGEIAERLRRAGYQRGDFMSHLMAARIASAARALTDGGLEVLQEHESAGDIDRIRAFLLPIHGVGPTVVWNFLALRQP